MEPHPQEGEQQFLVTESILHTRFIDGQIELLQKLAMLPAKDFPDAVLQFLREYPNVPEELLQRFSDLSTTVQDAEKTLKKAKSKTPKK